MERRHPARFPRDEQRVYDAYIAGRQSAALAVAVRIGLFEELDRSTARTEEALRSHLGLHARPFRALLQALLAMGMLQRDPEGRLTAAPDASTYLVRGKPGWLGGLLDLEVDNFLSPAALLEALQRGRPTVYGEEDPWEAHMRDPERARLFPEAMHSISERPAAGVAEVVDFTGVGRLLDVGGGSGALSLAIASAHSGVECVIWDLEVVCGIARGYAERAGLSDRVTAVTGDMFRTPFPDGYDAVLFSQILHDWPPEKGEVLLRKAFDALPSGGLLLVHEKLAADDGAGPLANALVNLDMALWTEGQQFSRESLQALAADTGFRDVEIQPTAGYWSVLSARKP
jgi:SAM-dependent methyltransferase